MAEAAGIACLCQNICQTCERWVCQPFSDWVFDSHAHLMFKTTIILIYFDLFCSYSVLIPAATPKETWKMPHDNRWLPLIQDSTQFLEHWPQLSSSKWPRAHLPWKVVGQWRCVQSWANWYLNRVTRQQMENSIPGCSPHMVIKKNKYQHEWINK